MTLTRRGWLVAALAALALAVLVCWALWDVLVVPGLNGAELLLVLVGVGVVAAEAVTRL